MADEDQFEAARPDPDSETATPEDVAGDSKSDSAQSQDVDDAAHLASEAMDDAAQAASELGGQADSGSTQPAGGAESAALAAAMEAIRMAQQGGESAAGSAPEASDAPQASQPGNQGDGAARLNLPNLDIAGAVADPQKLELLSDVNVTVKIELGRTRMLVEDVLKLGDGAVVELEKLAGDPVDIFVNERPVARGEVLVLNDNFCVRVNEILDRSSEEKD